MVVLFPLTHTYSHRNTFSTQHPFFKRTAFCREMGPTHVPSPGSPEPLSRHLDSVMLVNLEQSVTRFLARQHGGSSYPDARAIARSLLGPPVLIPTREVSRWRGPGCLGRHNLEMPVLWPGSPLPGNRHIVRACANELTSPYLLVE